MLNTNTPDIQFALYAVRRASRLVRQVQVELVAAAITKEDRSPVTVADFAAQALIGRLLEQQFPEDPLVGEEDSSVLRTPEQADELSKITHYAGLYTGGASPDEVCRWIDRGSAESGARFWTLDPIDGTKGFVRGDQYAVALALVEGGQVRLGVLGCPNLNLAYLQGDPDADLTGESGALIFAVRGEGAWIGALDGEDFSPVSVSDRSDPAQARLLRSYETAHTNTGQIGELVAHMGVTAPPVGLDSQAKYALLAAGRGDMLVRLLSSRQPDYREKIWDQAAGAIVVEEAGGRITDLHGRPLDFTRGRTLSENRGVLASNGHLHDAGLAALAAIEA